MQKWFCWSFFLDAQRGVQYLVVLCLCLSTHIFDTIGYISDTVEPLNKAHLGTQAAVPYSEVVPCWKVHVKTVILCTFTASVMR